MQKVFHKKISNSLSYAVHMIWRIKDPFWVCILSQNQTKVLWTKAVTRQMTRERWQIDLPWHSFQQKTQYLYWKVMGVCFSHSVIGVESHQRLSVEISQCSSFDLFLLLCHSEVSPFIVQRRYVQYYLFWHSLRIVR